MSVMIFGDIAAVVKPIPNVAITSEVQISAVGVYKGRLSYSAVVRDDTGNIVTEIGPYPVSAFRFLTHCDEGSSAQLISWLTKEGR